MIVRRSVVVKLPKVDCDIVRLQALTNLAYRYKELGICPEDIPRTACTMLYKRDFDLKFGTRPKKWFAREWLPMTVQRIQNGVKRGDSAERYVEPYRPETLIVVDANSWRHGVAIAYVNANRRIGFYTKSRPNLRLVDTLYRRAVSLWKLYSRLKRMGLHETPEGKRVYRELKRTTSRIYRILRDHSQKEAHNVVLRAVKVKAKVVIDNALEESWRDLLEEGLSKREAKVHMAGVRRFIKILETQLKWYGVPYEFKRLPSRLCPNCEIEMEELPGRRMKCPTCGLEEDRDKIPVLWALKLTS
jgi:putative transposase